MHKLVSNAVFAGGRPTLNGIKYFDLTKPNICAKFGRIWWFELHHSLPGFLMDTLKSHWLEISRMACQVRKIENPETLPKERF